MIGFVREPNVIANESPALTAVENPVLTYMYRLAESIEHPVIV